MDSDQDTVYPGLIQILREQLQEKDRQIKELHILLQGAHEQVGRMLTVGNGRPSRLRKNGFSDFDVVG